MVTRPTSEMRVMLDTSVLLSGIVWPRWPHEVLQHAVEGDYRLVLTPFLLAEVRRKFQERFPTYAARFEETLASIPYEIVPDPTTADLRTNLGLIRDVNDLPIALAAIQSGVDYFISEDRDFTDRNQTTALLHEQLTVLLSGTFLRGVMGWTSDELEQVRGRTWTNMLE